MKIQKLNKIYQKCLDDAELICSYFDNYHIEHKLGFYNNHEIKQKDHFVKEIYPIPVISCIVSNIEIDIGFDLFNTANYIGFLELTLNKSQILNFDFFLLKNIKFDIYGSENFKEDYYFGDIQKTKLAIMDSKEEKFHIGMEFSTIKGLKEIIEVLRAK